MVTSSAIAGLIGLVLSYALAIPLGSYMARFKTRSLIVYQQVS